MAICKLSWEQFKLNSDNYSSDFEDMCRSLFRKKYCHGEILHTNPNNPGIETAPFYDESQKKYIGFQAKFFEQKVSYSSISHSIDNAIKYYKGQLDIVYLFSNCSVSDSCASFIKIKDILNKNNIEIKLIVDKDLLDLIEQEPSIQAIFFNRIKLNHEWFVEKLETSIDDLGPRYNRDFNISTSVQNKLNIFAKNSFGCDYLNGLKTKVIEVLSDNRIRFSEYAIFAEELARYILAIQDINEQSVKQSSEWYNDISEKFSDVLKKMTQFCQSFFGIYEKTEDKKEKEKQYNKYIVIRDILGGIELLNFSNKDKKLIDNQFALLSGQIGTGKTQTIAHLVKQSIDTNIPAVLIPAQVLAFTSPINEQILNYLSIGDSFSFDKFLSALDEIGYETNHCAVFGIDAINESSSHNIWKQGLNNFITQFKHYHNIKLVISVKSDYKEDILPDRIKERIESLEYSELECTGFEEDPLHEVNLFLNKKGITEYPSSYFQRELANPFLLKLFCDVFSGNNSPTIKLFDDFAKYSNKKLSERINKTLPKTFTKDFIVELIKLKESSDSSYVLTDYLYDLSIWEHYGLSNLKTDVVDFYYHFGLIDKFLDSSGCERCYFGFNAMSNFYTAQFYVNQTDTIEKTKDVLFNRFLKNKETSSQDDIEIFGIACQLFADKYLEECIDLVDKTSPILQYKFVREYYRSLGWRNNLPSIREYVENAKKYNVGKSEFWTVFFECAVREKCNLNADGLTEFLLQLPIAKRDTLWTTYVNDLSEDDHILSLIEYINSGESYLFTNQKTKYLFLLFLCWMLTSSNRVIRDQTSRCIVKLLQNSFDMCLPLLKQFYNVDDTYIIQRLFGIVFGVCTRQENISEYYFNELVSWIYETVFNKKEVYPDILLRDYAHLIIEYYLQTFPESKTNIDKSKIKPPYCSIPIPLTKKFGNQSEPGSGYFSIVSSMTPNTKEFYGGWYGDFGRYVFQSRLEQFDGFDITNAYYYALHFIFEKLGYCDDLSNYDKNIRRYSFSRMENIKKERIGKKYQWIAFYNIAARASDQFNKLKTYSFEPKAYYEGTWNPFFRDFDPTTEPKIGYYQANFISSFKDIKEYFIASNSTKESGNNWVQQVCPLFQNVERKIKVTINGESWISLYNDFYYSLPGNNPLDQYSSGHQTLLFVSHAMIYPKKKEFKKEEIDCTGLNLKQYYTYFGRELLFSSCLVEQDVPQNQLESSCAEYLWESEYDASKEEPFTILMPNKSIIKELNLKKKNFENCFYHEDDMVVFSLYKNGNKTIFIKEKYLKSYLKENNLDIIWSFYGEKQFDFSVTISSTTRWSSIFNSSQLKNGNCEMNITEKYIQ